MMAPSYDPTRPRRWTSRSAVALAASLLALGALTAQTQLGSDIDGGAAREGAGVSVSLSAGGSRLAVGASGTSSAGRVRVYDYDGGAANGAGGWIQVGTDIVGEGTGDAFGSSVGLSADGTRLAVGANLNDGTGLFAGHVRVYQYTAGVGGAAGTWTQLGPDIDGEAAGDRSGATVSLSGDGSRVAIGAPINSGAGLQAGHVRVYTYDAGANGGAGGWTQVGLDIDGAAAEDQAGLGVSLSADGTTVAVGAPGADGGGAQAGSVTVYAYAPGANGAPATWTQVGAPIDGATAEDFSGQSVSLSADGTRVAVGALGNDAAGSNAGQVRVFDFVAGANGSTGMWTQIGNPVDGAAADDQAGLRLDLSADGRRLAVSAPLNDAAGSDAGHVRVFEFVPGSGSGGGAGAWNQVGTDVLGEAAEDFTGLGVALTATGDRLAVGAPLNDVAGDNAGRARVFTLPTAAVPVELVDFAAAYRPATAVTHLAWTTATEHDNAYFLVEHARSTTDESAFEAIATVAGRGNTDTPTDYAYRHATPNPGTHYYRLRQVDTDGTERVSGVVAVAVGRESAGGVVLYPNPAHEEVQVALSQNLAGATARVTVHDATGRTLLATTIAAGAPLDVSVLPKGVYGVRVAAGGVVTQTHLVKQ